MNKDKQNWSITDEINFLNGLGSWTKNPGDRIKLLEIYVRLTPQRSEKWVPKAMEHAYKLLQEEYPL